MGFEVGAASVIGVGLVEDIRLYVCLEVEFEVVTLARLCCRKSLLNISFSDPGANDQNEPRPSFAGRGTLTKAYVTDRNINRKSNKSYSTKTAILFL